MTQVKHVPSLDGWRGLAILALLLGHFAPIDGINLGNLGVNLFFVLSGMLMGRLLFVDRVSLDSFYRRRVSRILPAHLVFIGAVLLVAAVGAYGIDWRETLSALFFVNNYLFYNQSANVMPFGHVWSLAVEEHSYILLGLVALLARRREVSPTMILLTLCTASAGISYWYWVHQDLRKLVFQTWLHTEVAGYGIGISALIALQMARKPPSRLWAAIMPWLAVLGVALHWWSVPPPVRNTVGLAALAMAVNLLPVAGRWVQATLSAPALRYLGTWSFSLYLWQQPFYMASRHGHLSVALAIAAAVLAGLMSFYLVEQPARRWLNARWGRAAGSNAAGRARELPH